MGVDLRLQRLELKGFLFHRHLILPLHPLLQHLRDVVDGVDDELQLVGAVRRVAGLEIAVLDLLQQAVDGVHRVDETPGPPEIEGQGGEQAHQVEQKGGGVNIKNVGVDRGFL